MSSNPKVSVCIPAYKQTETLRRALKSLQNQTFRDFEVVVSDDTPDDRVASVVLEFEGSLRLRYFRNSIPLGSPANWNNALKNAKGEYLKLLHHDDWFLSDTGLEVLVKLLDNNPRSGMAYCASHDIENGEQLVSVHEVDDEKLSILKNDPTILFRENFIGAPSVTIFRSSFNQQYDESLKWLVDVDLYIQCLRQFPDIVFSRESLVAVGVDRGRVTNSCVGNGKVEIFEYMHVFEKLYRLSGMSKYMFSSLWNLFKFYRITDISQIRSKYNTTVSPEVEADVKTIIKSVKYYVHFETILQKILAMASPFFIARILLKSIFLSKIMIRKSHKK